MTLKPTSSAPSGRMTMLPTSMHPVRKFDEPSDYMMNAWYRSNGVHYPFSTSRRR